MNVIGFVYSALQICDIVKYLITRKHIVEHRLRGFFSFALDQVKSVLSSLTFRRFVSGQLIQYLIYDE